MIVCAPKFEAELYFILIPLQNKTTGLIIPGTPKFYEHLALLRRYGVRTPEDMASFIRSQEDLTKNLVKAQRELYPRKKVILQVTPGFMPAGGDATSLLMDNMAAIKPLTIGAGAVLSAPTIAGFAKDVQGAYRKKKESGYPVDSMVRSRYLNNMLHDAAVMSLGGGALAAGLKLRRIHKTEGTGNFTKRLITKGIRRVGSSF